MASFRNSKWNPFHLVRLCYDWVLKWAEHPQGVKALFGISLIESFIFPVPADILLIAMGAAKPKKALYYAFVCSVASIVGAFVGYAIGYGAWMMVSDFFFSYIFSEDIFNKVGSLFEQNAFLTVFTAAFTPIPFKVCTVVAGVYQLSLLPFFLAAMAGRSLRFFLVSGVIYIFGAKVRSFIEKYFELCTIAITVLAVLGVMAIKWIK